MARIKSPRFDSREAFYAAVAAGALSLAEVVKAMRGQMGMNQQEYANFVGVSLDVLRDIEQECGNPTQEVLNRVGRPFRLRVGLVIDPEINTASKRHRRS